MGRPKKKVEVIEKVAPHTIKKCELIEHYVDEWARKILGFNGMNGRDGSKGIIYIDCMSNSGLYYDSDDNLVDGTALRVAKRLNEILAANTGKPYETIAADTERDNYMSAQEAADYGLIDGVITNR